MSFGQLDSVSSFFLWDPRLLSSRLLLGTGRGKQASKPSSSCLNEQELLKYPQDQPSLEESKWKTWVVILKTLAVTELGKLSLAVKMKVKLLR